MLLRALISAATGPAATRPAATPQPDVPSDLTPVQPLFPEARPEEPVAVPETTIVNPADVIPTIPDDYLSTMLDAWDQRPERGRDGGTNGYMHVSTLVAMTCDRRSCLISQHDVEVMERPTGGHRLMWAQGRATETHIRSAVIGTTQGQNVHGRWSCKCGHAEHEGVKPDQQFTCERCRLPLDQYGEVTLRDDFHRITGNPDMILSFGNRFIPVEIKSMTEDDFEGLSAAKPDHVAQAAMYREMMAKLGYPVLDHVAILYGRKQFRYGGARSRSEKTRVYKEFLVDATAPDVRLLVDLCYEHAVNVAMHNAVRTLPERTKCSTVADGVRHKCPVSHLCFSMR